MPFSFERPIVPLTDKATGLPFVRVEVPLVVLNGSQGDAEYAFIFDTGCAITTVGRDVALALGLPKSGTPVQITGSTAKGAGYQVPVQFRFPDETDETGVTRTGLVVTSTWLVVTAGRLRLALLSFQDVHAHFGTATSQSDMQFVRWGELP